MKKLLLIGLFVVSLIAKESFETNEIKVEGNVLNKLILNVKALQTMNSFTTDSSPLICKSGGTKENVKSYEGVRLQDILNKAQVEINHKSDFNKLYIVARGADGYTVLFSYQEIFNTKNGKNIIVFYKKNGEFLNSKQGKIGLISMSDIHNGPRHIKWLDSIYVSKLK